MAGINHLKEVYEKKGEDFLNGLLNNYVIVGEKIDGAFFGVKKNKDDSFKYFKKSGEISYVDRVLMKYYNPAILHFANLPIEKRQRIPANFYFGFEYLTFGDSINRKYDRLPKNHLVLSYILKLNEKGEVISTIQNKEQLDRWADYLEVERPPIIFEGHLTDEQKTAILEFAYANEKELFEKFKTTSFTKYIISVLNSELNSSFLKNDLDGTIDAIVFRFYDETVDSPEAKVFLAKLVDPIFSQKVKEQPTQRESKSQDYIWLIVIDLMNHFEMYDLEDLRRMSQAGDSFEAKYLNLVNSIFKDFIEEYSQKYEGLELEIPDYLKRPEFELDKSLIKDPEVIAILKQGETHEEIYKILLNFFRKTRKKTTAGFFTPELLTQLNLIVAKIRNIIMGDEVYEGLFPSFNEFIGSANEELVLSEKEVNSPEYAKVEPVSVNLLIGKFQPVTMGHIKAAQKLKEKNGKKTIFIAIKGNGQSKLSPFSDRLTRTMLEKVQQEYQDLVEEVRIVPSGQIEEVLAAIQPEYTPALWGTTERRLKDYVLQMDYIRKKNIPLRLSKDFKLVELPTYVKSEDALKTIENSNFSEFKKIAPTSIASEFFNLQKELSSGLNESAAHSTTAFELEDDLTIELDPKLIEKELDQES